MDYLLVFSGLLLLLLSGDFLVKSAVSLSNYLRISPLVVGVVIVSLGTSAPELMVSLNASLQGYPDMAMGNVIGSNIANIALVLGITAVITPVFMNRQSVVQEIPVMLALSLLFYFIIYNGVLNRWEAFILFVILLGYILFSIIKSRASIVEAEIPKTNWPIWKALLIGVLSCLGLMYGAQWLIDGSSSVARDFGVSERVISITVIAFGTSLPELATSALAAFRKEMDISIGNIIGSNIFNLLGVMGIAGMVKPIVVDPLIVSVDTVLMLGFSFLLFLFALIPIKKPRIDRVKGFVFLCAYAFYVVFLLF